MKFKTWFLNFAQNEESFIRGFSHLVSWQGLLADGFSGGL
ncbi:hypothetical protein [Acinetobacter bereziniae]|nr:hypothetical protein ACINWC743_0197 [Acinetobacter sp. WC-743]CEI54238.1 hypothetical protein [Acinetobacter bereziniae]